jgi:putative heme iron utilization protein
MDLLQTAQHLLENSKHGFFSTLDSQQYPYASLVEIAPEGKDLLLFLSDLAEHSKNIQSNPKTSVLLAEDYDELSLAKARACFIGSIQREETTTMLEHYIKHHPKAERYKSFADFKLYRLKVERTYVVAGFGKMGWL